MCMQLNESNVSHGEQCQFGSRAITKLCVILDIIRGVCKSSGGD